ncbi:MAG TPA: hypothetical protein VKU41_18110 [Polyangiaceae bacterium]|nr:hypothetical protein [Polyangiaceae bacterium]
MPGPVIPFVRLNGQPYSWNSTMTRFNGTPWPGVIEFAWGETLEVEDVYSQTQDGKPIGGTAGQYKVETFTCKMLEEDADALTDSISLMPPYVGSIGRTEFNVECQASEPLAIGAKPIMLMSERTRIVGMSHTRVAGIEKLVREFKFWSNGLRINGKTLWTPAIPGVGSI